VLRERGHWTRHHGKGELHVQIRIRPHPDLVRRSKFDLHLNVGISLATAILGGDITVRSNSVKIEPFSRDGDMATLPGKGLPKSKVSRGDLVCEFRIDYPRSLTKIQRDLILKFDQEEKKKL
jgi:DnaJ-class molecular chaperone